MSERASPPKKSAAELAGSAREKAARFKGNLTRAAAGSQLNYNAFASLPHFPPLVSVRCQEGGTDGKR